MRRCDCDEDWRDLAALWELRSDTIYLNHGSFGPAPRPVIDAQRAWQDRLRCQPMDFFTRQFAPAWESSRADLARFLHAEPDHLVFVENATAGMNVVAHSFPLVAGDEVLLTDHEYGAVRRIWQRRCDAAGARLRTATLPARFEDVEDVVRAILDVASDSTRLLVVSHITSPTAIILPVAEICRRARERGLATCIDGPHAIAQVPLDLAGLDCDFYTASCHKWLSAPFGSGFLYVAPSWQSRIQPPQLSWGRLLPERPTRWWEEFIWTGTRDPSAYLATGDAVRFLERVGGEMFRERTHALAQYARHRLVERFGLEPLVPDRPRWYGSMAHVPLPPCDAGFVQQTLWRKHGIEVPIVEFAGRCFVRVSCHLYNHRGHIDRLVDALSDLLR